MAPYSSADLLPLACLIHVDLYGTVSIVVGSSKTTEVSGLTGLCGTISTYATMRLWMILY